MTVSWVTPIASGSTRAGMAGTEAGPGEAGAGRCVIWFPVVSAGLCGARAAGNGQRRMPTPRPERTHSASGARRSQATTRSLVLARRCRRPPPASISTTARYLRRLCLLLSAGWRSRWGRMVHAARRLTPRRGQGGDQLIQLCSAGRAIGACPRGIASRQRALACVPVCPARGCILVTRRSSRGRARARTRSAVMAVLFPYVIERACTPSIGVAPPECRF